MTHFKDYFEVCFSVFQFLLLIFFLIFINFLFFPPFFGTRIRSRSPHNELRFILHMIDADRLDLSIFLCARFHLFHDDVTGIHTFIYDKMFYRRKGHFFHPLRTAYCRIP